MHKLNTTITTCYSTGARRSITSVKIVHRTFMTDHQLVIKPTKLNLVNPLDVAKTRLQAQAAGVPYQGICGPHCIETNTVLTDLRSSMPKTRSVVGFGNVCPPECNQYKGTLDVLSKIIRQEYFGAGRIVETLERNQCKFNIGHADCKTISVGIYMPCYDIFRNLMEEFTTQNAPNLTPYVPFVAGSLARSMACFSCYPIELARTRMQAFKQTQDGVKLPGVWRTLTGAINPVKSTNHLQKFLHEATPFSEWWSKPIRAAMGNVPTNQN